MRLVSRDTGMVWTFSRKALTPSLTQLSRSTVIGRLAGTGSKSMPCAQRSDAARIVASVMLEIEDLEPPQAAAFRAFAPPNILIISRLYAGISSGLRLVTTPLSTMTS